MIMLKTYFIAIIALVCSLHSYVGATLQMNHSSTANARAAGMTGQVRRRLNVEEHRVEAIGFDWLAPWASGLALRHPIEAVNQCCGTLIIYSIMPYGATATRNTNFYLVAMIELYSGNVDFPKHYFHSFVVSGPLQRRTAKLLTQLLELLPPHHGFEIHNSTAALRDQPYRFSRQVGYALSRTDLRPFSSFAMLNSKSAGPFYAPYWNSLVTPMWTDALSQLLTDEVRAVGRTLNCPTGADSERVKLSIQKRVPYFEGPVVVDRVGLELARGGHFEVFSGKFVYSLLIAGYNVEALHGQPHGSDWRRMLKNPLVSGWCTTEIEMFMNHPYEGLFVNRGRKLESGFEKVYMESVRQSRELVLAKPVLGPVKPEPPPVRRPTDRVLVLYAYYEKTPQYKENLLFFIKTAVYKDAMLGDASLTDYIVIVNGDHTVNFPMWPNLHVIARNNSCLDFGSWGVAIAQHRSREHGYFFVINASVKGPFLPQWFREHWSQAFISRLQGEVAAVGLSVNCPDGVGRGVPHIMTMAVMFDRRVMKLADQKGLFSCVESYQVGLSREADFSIAIMDAGYNLASMQTAQLGMDFRMQYKEYLADKGNIHSGCGGIDLDIFFKEGWYQGMSPNPMEFVFLKVSRDVSMHTSDVVGNMLLEETRFEMSRQVQRSTTPPHILLMMHSLDMDGAPRLLFEMGAMLVQEGYQVTFGAFATGALANHITAAGANLAILGPSAGASVRTLVADMYTNFDLIIFNTIVWANMIGAQSYSRIAHPKIMWLIHEGELHMKHAVENADGDKFWYGLQYDSIKNRGRQRNTLQKADKVVFVADKVRSIWGDYDTGHFETFRGFVSVKDVEARAAAGLENEPRLALLDSISASEDTFIITTVGTICKRKNQFTLAKALENVGESIFQGIDYKLVVIGAPSNSGGRGDSTYYQKFRRYVERSDYLNQIVRFVPFSNDALGYLALSRLHMSVSVAEAFPLNVLEAMALSVPVMVTPAGGSEEAFMQPGVDGLLLPNIEYSRKMLENSLVEQLQGKLDRLHGVGQEGHRTLLRKYTKEAARSRLKSLISRTLGEKVRGAQGNVCIVVRTYAGHMSDPVFSLRNLLQSLLDQEYTHWTAFVANTDSKPMDGLYSLLADLNDHRLHVVDPPEPVEFVLGSFAVTDRIVADQCPEDTDWLLVTNGDNVYDKRFLNHLDLRKDVIGYDFYSRSSHILDTGLLGGGCHKFFDGGQVACKKNLLKSWHTDLGSYVINYKRWMLEGRTFEPMDKDKDGAADGYAMESLVYYGWQVKLVDASIGCLFGHSPNMFYCLNNSYTKSALWDSERNACVVEPDAIEELRQTHIPYTNPDLPYEMRLFQDRCMDIRVL
jgi:glycosyltransferase involved in cell wall biosynthesis